MAPYQANTHRYQAVSWRRETTLMTMTSEVQERMRRQARLAFAEPQPSLAMHLQMHCKDTKNRGAMQAFSDFISDFSEMLKCKDFRFVPAVLTSSRPHILTFVFAHRETS